MTKAQKLLSSITDEQYVIFYKLNKQKKYMVINNNLFPFLDKGDYLDVTDLETNEPFTFRIKRMNKKSISADLIIN